MLAIMSSLFAGLIDVLKSIGKIITNFPNILVGLFNSLIAYLYCIIYYSFMGTAYILNFGELLFKKFAGLSPMHTNDGKTADIVTIFISSNSVWSLFVSIIVLSIVLLMLFTFIAIIKSEFSLDAKGSAKGPIIARAFKSLAMFIIVPAVSVMGIYATNALTQTINGMFRNGDEVALSNQIFYVAAYNANRARTDSVFRTYISGGTVQGTIDKYKLPSGSKNRNNDQFSTDPSVVANDIDEAFRGNCKMEGNEWVNLDFSSRVDSGLELSCLLGLCPYNWNATTFTPWHVGAVNYYYDVTAIDYVLGLATAVYMALLLTFMSASLIKRVFELTILLLLAPPLIAMGPLDGGNAQKKWQGEFIKRVIMIIGPVFSINMYFVLVPVFMSISIFNPADFVTQAIGNLGTNSGSSLMGVTNASAALSAFSGGSPKANGLAQILALIVGMQIVKQSSALLSNLLGMADLVKESGDNAKKAVETAGKAASTVAAVYTGGAAFVAKRIAAKKLAAAKDKTAGAKSKLEAARSGGNAEEIAQAEEEVKAAEAEEKEAKGNYTGREKDARKAFDKLPGIGGAQFGATIQSFSDANKSVSDAQEGKGDGSKDREELEKKERNEMLIAHRKKQKQAAAADADSAAVGAEGALDQIPMQDYIKKAEDKVSTAQAAKEGSRDSFESLVSAITAANASGKELTDEQQAFLNTTGLKRNQVSKLTGKKRDAAFKSYDDKLGADLEEAQGELGALQYMSDSKNAKRVFNENGGEGFSAGNVTVNSESGNFIGKLPQEVAQAFVDAGKAEQQRRAAEATRESNISKKVQDMGEEQEAQARYNTAQAGDIDGKVDAAIDRNEFGDAVQQGIEESLSALKSAMKEALQGGKLDIKGFNEMLTSLRDIGKVCKDRGPKDTDDTVIKVLKDELEALTKAINGMK